jgi:hypothetical protein
MNAPRLGLIFAWCLLSLQCGQTSSRDLAGTYVVRYRFGREELIMRASGVYEQRIWLAAGAPAVTHRGSWKYLAEGGFVALAHPLLAATETGDLRAGYGKPAQGDWLLPVERHFGKARLVVSEDLGLYLERVEEAR